jgi:beta-phosphoglucomutase-like phosphatase (HAD superfamily)
LLAAIFDVDGVLVDSPHEQAWREALSGFAEPAVLQRGDPPIGARGSYRARLPWTLARDF